MEIYYGEKVNLNEIENKDKRKYLENNLYISDNDIYLLNEKTHNDVYSILGLHYLHYEDEVYIIIRSLINSSQKVYVNSLKEKSFVYIENIEMDKIIDNFYVLLLKIHIYEKYFFKIEKYPKLKYEFKVIYNDNNINTYIDSYQFPLLLLEEDLDKFQSGSHWFVDKFLGNHELIYDDIKGIRFAVWSVNSINITIVGDFNLWQKNTLFMRKRKKYNVYEIFIPYAKKGESYGYNIIYRENNVLNEMIKIDPYAQMFEIPPKYNSIISTCDDDYREEKFCWTDWNWINKRIKYKYGDTEEEHNKKTNRENKFIYINGQHSINDISFNEKINIYRESIIIYEMHVPSWRRGKNNEYLNYKDIADYLINHVKELHCTHIEFLPLHQHPFEGSWGYQISGLYAPFSKLGNPDDLKYLINKLHENNIGVILDIVLGHFVKDVWGLSKYDGDFLYEYSDIKEGEIIKWGTKIFNYRRNEVRCFLLGCVYHWIRTYHIDGIRLDAVSCMIYKDYERKEGEWIPNQYGTNQNLEAISLLKELNYVIHKYFPGIITIAEESTTYENITNINGLNFDFKWDLGWMNDTLSYTCLPAYERYKKHNNITFRNFYVSTEKWVLPLSHDEVVSGKGSILDKCSYLNTSLYEKIQNLKVLIAYQCSIPGIPLLFMGLEYGQNKEWNYKKSLDWHELYEHPIKKKCFKCICDIIKIKRENIALYKGDNEPHNFKWTDCDNAKDNIFSYIRSYEHIQNDILIILNFSGNFYQNYPIGIPHSEEWVEILNTNDEIYSDHSLNESLDLSFLKNYDKKINISKEGRYGWNYCMWINIPPFTAIYLKPKIK